MLRLATFFGLILMLAATLACAPRKGGADPADLTPDNSDPKAIESLDLTKNGELLALGRLNGGTLDPKAVIYADVTGDGREEAIAPLSSTGTRGNILYLVFSTRRGEADLIFTRAPDKDTVGGIVMTVENGVLIEMVGEYGPEDPLCCPSLLRKTTFHWDGNKFAVASQERVPNPDAPKALTGVAASH